MKLDPSTIATPTLIAVCARIFAWLIDWASSLEESGKRLIFSTWVARIELDTDITGAVKLINSLSPWIIFEVKLTDTE